MIMIIVVIYIYMINKAIMQPSCSCCFFFSIFQIILFFLFLSHPFLIPYFIFIVNKPCCPKRISLKNVNIASQTIGVISTPKAGGTDPLISLNNGSVGQATILYGGSLRLALGYHEITTRHSYELS